MNVSEHERRETPRMTPLDERIAQFRKMASDDPDNELGHYRLGQLLLEAGQLDAAAQSFRRTLELSPQFSKVFQLLGQCLIQADKKDEAIQVLTEGFGIADERGDNIPRDEMAKLLVQLGQPIPVSKRTAKPAGATGGGEGEGFPCQRPGCTAGRFARQLPKGPFGGPLGEQIREKVCADCWDYWLKNLSIKVINEMRLDLSTEQGAEMYDNIMKETLGLT
jgi:tetratricopeptide (TPR) repeat protein